MFRFTKSVVQIGVILLLGLSTLSCHQDDAETMDATQVYQKFFEVAGAKTQYEQMRNIFIAQFRQGFSSGVENALRDANPEKKDKIVKLAGETIERFLTQLQGKMDEIMPFEALVTDVYIPVYSKYFTIDEIREITSFYESKVGKKFASAVPSIMQSATDLINNYYTPRLQGIASDLAKQEFATLKSQIEKIE